MNARLEIGTSEEPGALRLALSGELTAERSEQAREAFGEAERRRPAVLRVDLSDLRVLDSSGLGLIIGLHKRCAENNISLRLMHPQPIVMRTFRLTRLDRALNIEARPEDAAKDAPEISAAPASHPHESAGLRVAAGLARDVELQLDMLGREIDRLRAQTGDSRPSVELEHRHLRLKSCIRSVRELGRSFEAPPVASNLRSIASESLIALTLQFPGIMLEEQWEEGTGTAPVDEGDLREIIFQAALYVIESMREKNGGVLRVSGSPVPQGSVAPATAFQEPVVKSIRVVFESGDPLFAPRARRFDPLSGEGHASPGLTTAYGLLRQYDGWIESAMDAGGFSRIEVFVPVDATRPPQGPTAEAPPVHHILIVDDESLVLNFAAAYLERAGYKVHKAEHPSQAVELLESKIQRIDLVIVDLSLPGMTGRELMRRIQKIEPGIQFLVSSGMGDIELAEAAAEAGSAAPLQKPYRGDDLLNAVRRRLIK